MANDRNAGRPPKFPKGVKLKSLQIKVPEKGFKETRDAVGEFIKNQFKDYDWT